MSQLQAVLFNRLYWTQREAEEWLKYNRIFPMKEAHFTKKFIRYRIQNPGKFKRIRTDKIQKWGIDLLFGF